MEKLTLSAVSKLTSPNPLCLICTLKEDGNTNVATVSWYTYLSFHPEMMAFCMSKKSYSGEMVRKNKKVLLTIPGENMAEIVKKCGTSTGRTINKVEEHNIDMINIPDCDIMAPSGSNIIVELSLSENVEVGDHILYICNVDNIYQNNTGKILYSFNGYAKIDTI